MFPLFYTHISKPFGGGVRDRKIKRRRRKKEPTLSLNQQILLHLTLRQRAPLAHLTALTKDALGQLTVLAHHHAVHQQTLAQLGALANLAVGANDALLDASLFLDRDIVRHQRVLLGDSRAWFDALRVGNLARVSEGRSGFSRTDFFDRGQLGELQRDLQEELGGVDAANQGGGGGGIGRGGRVDVGEHGRNGAVVLLLVGGLGPLVTGLVAGADDGADRAFEVGGTGGGDGVMDLRPRWVLGGGVLGAMGADGGGLAVGVGNGGAGLTENGVETELLGEPLLPAGFGPPT